MSCYEKKELSKYYKIIPNILLDMQQKENKKLEYGVYTINVKIEGNGENVKVLIMPEFTGILDEDDNLIYVFSKEYLTDDEEETDEEETDEEEIDDNYESINDEMLKTRISDDIKETFSNK